MADTVEVKKIDKKNIHPPAAQCLAWKCDDINGSLVAVCAYADQVGREAVERYWKNIWWKRLFSRWIQFLALALAAGGGIYPIIATIFKPRQASPDSGLVTSVLVGLAAALLGLDKAFGFSSGWARFVLTACTIQKTIVEFHLDWMSLIAARCAMPSPDRTMALIQRAKDFVSTVEGLVLQETKNWVSEFQTNMSQLEKDVKAQLDTLNAKVEKARQDQEAGGKPGSLELTVPDADKADDFEFQVTLEPSTGALPTEKVSNTKVWVKTGVPPGHCKITLSATVSGRTVSNQAVADIPPGEIFKATVPLGI
jgi:hypothetical protein